MYRKGHYGAALLAFAPLGFGLTATGYPEAALVLGAVVVGLTPLPDYDQRVPGIDHRGVTHTLGFALLVGAVVGGAGFLAGRSAGPAGATVLGGAGFVAGTLSMLAHLAADVVTPAGIAPFWPLSSRNYSLDLVRAANTPANYLLLLLGVVAAAGALWAGTRVGGI